MNIGADLLSRLLYLFFTLSIVLNLKFCFSFVLNLQLSFSFAFILLIWMFLLQFNPFSCTILCCDPHFGCDIFEICYPYIDSNSWLSWGMSRGSHPPSAQGYTTMSPLPHCTMTASSSLLVVETESFHTIFCLVPFFNSSLAGGKVSTNWFLTITSSSLFTKFLGMSFSLLV